MHLIVTLKIIAVYQSFISAPQVTNMIIAPDNQRTRVRIQNYSDLNPVALRRILTDPNSPSNAILNQTYATLLLYFDPEIQLFRLPETLLAPPQVSNEPGKSRIWNDFTFQEIGKGDDFLGMESIIEKDPGSPQAMASGIAPPHPYLSVEKATRVNQWVERAEMENEVEPELEPEANVAPQPDPPREESPVAPTMRKPPGIRTRKAATAAKPQPVATPDPTPEPAKAPSPKNASTPRKRWIMQYGSESEDRLVTFPENTKPESANRSPSGALLLDRSPDSSNGASMIRPQTPDSKLRVSVNFDPTKYGLAKTPQHAAKISLGSPTTSGNNGESQQLMTPRRRTGKNELVDVFAPVTQESAVSHPQMSFDQPALIPRKPNEAAENVFGQGMSLVNTGKISDDLLGLNFGGEVTASESSNATQLAMAQIDSNGDYLSWQEKRLQELKRSLRERKKGTSDLEESVPHASGPPERRHISMLLARQKLAELEKNLETVKKTTDETSTREFHRTMNHKMARPTEKAKSKAEAKTKRQATLEDAWGIIKKPAKEAESSNNKADGVDGNSKKDKRAETSESKQDPQNSQRLLEEMEAHQKHMESLFDSLKPALEAAEFFTGPLTLEAQFGLILIPLLPKTYDENLISLDEWMQIFQPRNGLAPPTTKFINRLTTAGSDVDHIVDLKTSKAEGKRHLFEQEYTEYSVSYEFHCRTTADQQFIIAIDEQGRHIIRKPNKTLGAVNLHFPKQTWDASIVLGGIIEHIMGSDPELEEAVQYLVDNLWVQPDRSLVRIFSRLPKGNKFVIEKALMKRWTRHRHIRPVDTVPAKNVPPENPSSPSDSQALVLVTTENENNDIFLQVLEVQDLLIGSSTSDNQALRARCAPIPEMLKKDRLWYEVSLVSPAIEAILKANAGVEIGERTEDWRSTDILGKDSLLFSDDIGHGIPLLSPVAAAIGAAGLGELFTLTKTVVEKIDGVGFWNYGPGVEAVRVAAATAAAGAGAGAGASIAAPLFLPIGMSRQTSSALVKTEQHNKIMGFDDLDSIKEVESVLAKTAVPAAGAGVGATAVAPGLERTSSAATSSARVMEQGIDELDYW